MEKRRDISFVKSCIKRGRFSMFFEAGRDAIRTTIPIEPRLAIDMRNCGGESAGRRMQYIASLGSGI